VSLLHSARLGALFSASERQTAQVINQRIWENIAKGIFNL
jgi:hypothetical protein